MCGIVAIINEKRKPAELVQLAQMAETIRHRGPDEEGHLLEGSIGLYSVRLAIIDLISGQQPLTCEHATIAFNGAIYNYQELRTDLLKRGHTFRTQSDTEVLLRMYLEYGPDCLRFLNGMFAFVIYDRKKNIIMAARDHFGIKPLYYFEDKDHSFLFASEIKALLKHPAVIVDPNYDTIKDYIIFQFPLGEETFFTGVNKILPGHYKIIDLNSMNIDTIKYWEPDFTVDSGHDENYFAGKLWELLSDAVNIQLRSDVPVGTYLSGGLDSSTVTMLAAQMIPGKLKTFTGAFDDGPDFNETEYARVVATACAADNYEIYPSENEFIEILPKLIYHMDEPAGGPGIFPQYMVSSLASENVKVVLGGQGGDEIFGGYARYVIAYLEQALKGAIFETSDEGEHIVSLRSILNNLPSLKQYLPMLQRFWEQDLFRPMDRRYFRLIDRSGGDLDVFSKEFRDSIDPEMVFSRFQQVFNHPTTLSYYNKMVHFDMVASLPALLQVEDRVTMAVSLESRVPLLDYRIAELIARMPPRMKFKGAEMKYILKKAVRDIVPKHILERKDKMGFPVPLQIWAKGRFGEFLKDILLSSTCRERGMFDCSEIARLIEHEETFGRQLWGVLNLELWFRQFNDK
ncbi:asparagine synthase (glutamine-hydrolyzing) [Acidobacteriota bacterium]